MKIYELCHSLLNLHVNSCDHGWLKANWGLEDLPKHQTNLHTWKSCDALKRPGTKSSKVLMAENQSKIKKLNENLLKGGKRFPVHSFQSDFFLLFKGGVGVLIKELN